VATLMTRMFGSARHGQPNAEVFIFRVESTYAGLRLTFRRWRDDRDTGRRGVEEQDGADC
jgi:hypothetical protein